MFSGNLILEIMMNRIIFCLIIYYLTRSRIISHFFSAGKSRNILILSGGKSIAAYIYIKKYLTKKNQQLNLQLFFGINPPKFDHLAEYDSFYQDFRCSDK